MKPSLVLLLAFHCSVAYAQTVSPTDLSLAAALRSTVDRHPLLQVEQQRVEVNRAALVRASSQFDPLFQSEIGHGRLYQPLTQSERALLGASATAASTTGLTLRAERSLRNGITAGTTMDVNRTADALAAPLGLNQSHLALTLTLPLLRGRGRDVVMAPETAAGIDVEASVLDVTQSISDLLFNTAGAYWNAVAALRLEAVYRNAEDRGRVYVETVQTLVDADRLPRSEISQVQANLASRAAARLAAQQRLSESKQQLAIAMGLGRDELWMLPDPSDALPADDSIQGLTLDDRMVRSWIERALTRRADLLALRKRQGSATVLRGAAQDQFRPQLDLQLTTGYSGLGEGRNPNRYFASPFVGVGGADAVANIRYQFPIGRRAAQAALMEADSNVRQTAYLIDEAIRTIASDVITAAEAVRHAAEQFRQARLSVEYSQLALDNEREKLRLGVGSLLDVLTVEERLTSVLSFGVQSELALAQSIVRLRHATGSIVAPDTTNQSLDPSVFMTLPEPVASLQ